MVLPLQTLCFAIRLTAFEWRQSVSYTLRCVMSNNRVDNVGMLSLANAVGSTRRSTFHHETLRQLERTS